MEKYLTLKNRTQELKEKAKLFEEQLAKLKQMDSSMPVPEAFHNSHDSEDSQNLHDLHNTERDGYGSDTQNVI